MKSIVTLLMLIISCSTFAQNNKTNEIWNGADAFSMDNLGNLYIIKESIVFKADTIGKILLTYSNNNQDRFTYVDAIDPLRIMLFADEFSIISFLDNKLALQSVINLREQNFYDIRAVCNSTDGFWCYDHSQQQLFKYDFTLQKIAETQPLALLINNALTITSMCANDKWLACLNNNSGILIFDRLGSYVRSIEAKHASSIMLLENMLVYAENNQLVFFDFKLNLETSRLKTGLNNISSIKWYHNRFYLLSDNKIFQLDYKKD
ncbi:MAG: hypothetical protein V9G42_07405 [Bacteroidia bacterium]